MGMLGTKPSEVLEQVSNSLVLKPSQVLETTGPSKREGCRESEVLENI
jgi:hypothetical protein